MVVLYNMMGLAVEKKIALMLEKIWIDQNVAVCQKMSVWKLLLIIRSW